MGADSGSIQDDSTRMKAWLATRLDTRSVASFVPGPGIARLNLMFDIAKLREALTVCLSRAHYQGNMQAEGFAALPLTRRPGVAEVSENDLSGRYWLRPDDSYEEVPREEYVDEAAYSEFDPMFAGTYFEEVYHALSQRFTIGRLRVLSKGLYNCNSWHRDPEPRLHIPVVTNPGSLFIVNHHVTHLPADGSVYFTDTRGYHTALNGGETQRVHIVAALPDGRI
ncbi:hypothetical protein [Limibacillus halophilus]|uniref:Aspartyl/Asparaginyl beta-hydroxylase n=1 Tax=Limibacillus halophilus TaxID=1579333 RepID=A0A839SUV2_9PROT|nr:hypothetical protein [Limibacillus halophilus]MBB3066252.1 hypothetical protein [Limibacillus halophilus]